MLTGGSFEGAIAFARDLVRIPSPSGDEGAVSHRVLNELKHLRFDDVWIDGIGNVLARVKGEQPEPSLMLCSHLDVVDTGELTLWEYPPFDGAIASGYLHGRGAIDCKGGLALQTYAAARFIESRPVADIYLAFTVFEERGSWGMTHLMKQGKIKPAAVILGEATGGGICIGHRGRAELVISIQGEASHASAPDRGHNPVQHLPAVLAALHNFGEQIPPHPVLGRDTVVPTMIETWPKSPNMVPEQARVVVDWRTASVSADTSAADRLGAYLHEHLGPGVGDRVTVREVCETMTAYTNLKHAAPISTAGFLLSASHPLISAARGAISGVTGSDCVVRPWTFGTDGGCSCGIYGFPTIGYATGDEAVAHTNRERLHIESARTVHDAYPLLIRDVQMALMTA